MDEEQEYTPLKSVKDLRARFEQPSSNDGPSRRSVSVKRTKSTPDLSTKTTKYGAKNRNNIVENNLVPKPVKNTISNEDLVPKSGSLANLKVEEPPKEDSGEEESFEIRKSFQNLRARFEASGSSSQPKPSFLRDKTPSPGLSSVRHTWEPMKISGYSAYLTEITKQKSSSKSGEIANEDTIIDDQKNDEKEAPNKFEKSEPREQDTETEKEIPRKLVRVNSVKLMKEQFERPENDTTDSRVRFIKQTSIEQDEDHISHQNKDTLLQEESLKNVTSDAKLDHEEYELILKEQFDEDSEKVENQTLLQTFTNEEEKSHVISETNEVPLIVINNDVEEIELEKPEINLSTKPPSFEIDSDLILQETPEKIVLETLNFFTKEDEENCEMIQKDEPNIEKEEEVSIHIERILSNPNLMSISLLNDSFLILISSFTPEKFAGNDTYGLEIKNISEITKEKVGEYNPSKRLKTIYVTDKEYTQDEFDVLCLRFGNKSCHQFRLLDSGQLEWEKSGALQTFHTESEVNNFETINVVRVNEPVNTVNLIDVDVKDTDLLSFEVVDDVNITENTASIEPEMKESKLTDSVLDKFVTLNNVDVIEPNFSNLEFTTKKAANKVDIENEDVVNAENYSMNKSDLISFDIEPKEESEWINSESDKVITLNRVDVIEPEMSNLKFIIEEAVNNVVIENAENYDTQESDLINFELADSINIESKSSDKVITLDTTDVVEPTFTNSEFVTSTQEEEMKKSEVLSSESERKVSELLDEQSSNLINSEVDNDGNLEDRITQELDMAHIEPVPKDHSDLFEYRIYENFDIFSVFERFIHMLTRTVDSLEAPLDEIWPYITLSFILICIGVFYGTN